MHTVRLHVATAAAIVVVAAAAAVANRQSPRASSGPPVPYVDKGACPFEGCVYREWTARGRVVARTAPRGDAPVAFTLVEGEKVTAVTGFVTTLKPGRVEFRKAVDLDTARGRLHIEPGQVLFLLTYFGEGSTRAWFNGRMYDWVDGSMAFFNDLCDTDPRAPAPCDGKIVEKPKSVWWVKLKNHHGVTGWTNRAEQFHGIGLYED